MKTKDTIIIRIDDEPFTCLIRESGHIFIEEKIKKFLNPDYDKGSVMILHTVEMDGIMVFPLMHLVRHLRPRILKQFALEGFLYRINKAIEERDNQQERVLSEFDKIMLKALNYNP
jgi:hypothetical protein